MMKWSECRELYPNQFVKLKVLSSYIESGQEFIKDIEVIKPVSDEWPLNIFTAKTAWII